MVEESKGSAELQPRTSASALGAGGSDVFQSIDQILRDVDEAIEIYHHHRNDLERAEAAVATLRDAALRPELLSAWKAAHDRSPNLFCNASYFLDALRRVLATEYAATEADSLHAHKRGYGILVTEVDVPVDLMGMGEGESGGAGGDGSCALELIDVSSRRPRRKRMHAMMDGVQAVVFLIDLTGYQKVNRSVSDLSPSLSASPLTVVRSCTSFRSPSPSPSQRRSG